LSRGGELCITPESFRQEQNPESRRALYSDPHLHPLPHRERRQNTHISPYRERRQGLAVAELGVVDYDDALAMQTAMLAARLDGRIGDTLLMMEHPHVFTLGRGADERFIAGNPAGVPIRRVSRGGQVTYHGPGQLVGYPILKLEGSDRDVTKYLRALEAAMIDALAKFGIEAGRRETMTGVWVGARKIASIGVGLRRWTTWHGFALNVSTDLSYFDSIVPCGIEGCRMTSICEVTNRAVSVREFAGVMRESFARVFNYDETVSVGASEITWTPELTAGDG
jgi:lipoate-protein ligase B